MNPPTLLLVDDNPSFLRVAARFCDQHPDELHLVATAQDGAEALDKAVDIRPDLVLMDLNMPGMGGLEAIRKLRQMLPDVGIIALTLLDKTSYLGPTLEAGADEFVCKPTLVSDLLPAIRRVVAARGSGAEEGVA